MCVGVKMCQQLAMPKHQQRQQKTPYARTSAEPEKQGLFARIKDFIWGKKEHSVVHPPRVIACESDTSVNNSFSSRITHNSVEASSAGQKLLDYSSFSAPQPHNSSLNGLQGPNEALRQFFEDKRGENLSNMEIVGVLSLIGQAFTQNESLVDFSNLSELTSIQSDQTPADASILRALNVPPSPRPYLKGTPPPSHVQARTSLADESRSPWTSPRPSRIGARHSIGFGGRQTPRLSKPSRMSLTHERSAFTEEATPAAVAILKALEAPSKRVLTRDAKALASLPSTLMPSTSTASTSTPFKAPSSLAEPSKGPSVSSPLRMDHSQTGTIRDALSSSSLPESLVNTDTCQKVPESAPKEPGSSGFEGEILPSFEFTIPRAQTSRQMTPAEEQFVAQSQSEYQF